MALAHRFRSLFSRPQAKPILRGLRPHVRLGTFNLTTTSLRYLSKWFERLDDIAKGQGTGHGNFYSDPAAIGLIDATRTLTAAGQAFFAKRAALAQAPARAEYELVKILYGGGYAHAPEVVKFLAAKRAHLLRTLSQFRPSPGRDMFVSNPKLLTIAEIVANFPGALPQLLDFSRDELKKLSDLGENGFKNLCSGPAFSKGLRRLCGKIGSDYSRGEERRLHFVISMALLEISRSVPAGKPAKLAIPYPYSQLLTETDIYQLYAAYTSDITVWFDGIAFQVSTGLSTPVGAAAPLAVAGPGSVSLKLLKGIPGGGGKAGATDKKRNRKRGAKAAQVTVVIDTVLSQTAEDFVESVILKPQYGDQLVRVGHRAGEVIALPDGMVPGADFYVVGQDGDPAEFVEVKSISGKPPADVNLTRPEYLRACRCAAEGIPYRLFLIDVESGASWEVKDFAAKIAKAQLKEVRQFVVGVG